MPTCIHRHLCELIIYKSHNYLYVGSHRSVPSLLLLQEVLQSSRAVANFLQDLCGRRQRVKAHDNTSAKLWIWRFINSNKFTSGTNYICWPEPSTVGSFLSPNRRAEWHGDCLRLDSPKMSPDCVQRWVYKDPYTKEHGMRHPLCVSSHRHYTLFQPL
jgi:hypothetical protein